MQKPLAPIHQTTSAPSTAIVSAAIHGPGKVRQNELVVKRVTNSGSGAPLHARATLGQTNM